MFADLAADTAVRADPDVARRYHLTLPDHWDYQNPSGGVVMTCALRAAVAEIADPGLRLASATSMFVTPIRSGALVADVHPIRRGGGATQVRVALRNPDRGEGVELIATFLRDRIGPDVRGVAPPKVKSVAEADDVDDGAPNNPYARFRFYRHIQCKIADGEKSWYAFTAGPARYARWFRYKVPQLDRHVLDRHVLDRLALPPVIDVMPTALHRAIGPGSYRFHAPSLDLTTYMIDDTTREWLLVAVTMRRARVGLAIADAEVWDDEGRFIAYGSQAMYLHGLSGEPPTVDASTRS